MVFFPGWEMRRPLRLGLDVVGGDGMSFWTVSEVTEDCEELWLSRMGTVGWQSG